MLLNPGEDLIVTEPNGPMLVTVLFPELNKALEDFKLEYEFKVSERIYYVKVNGSVSRIICLSMENFNRIRGQNICAVLADEFATSKDEIAMAAYNMFSARLRAGTVRQIILCSTPENFGTMYKIAVTDAKKYRSRLIKARTFDNPHVPKEFIDNMLATYSPEQIQSYVYGEFQNLTSGSVYNFDRIENHADINLDGSETEIYMAADFNTNAAVSIFSLFIDGEIYIYDEWVCKDSFETRDRLLQEYPNADIYCAADASGGKSRSTSISDHEILKDHPGLVIVQGAANPSINRSILSVNAGLKKQKIWVDTNKCPKLADALERIAYDPKTQKPMKSTEHAGGSFDDFSDCARYKVDYLIPLNLPQLQQRNQYT